MIFLKSSLKTDFVNYELKKKKWRKRLDVCTDNAKIEDITHKKCNENMFTLQSVAYMQLCSFFFFGKFNKLSLFTTCM